MGRCRKLHNEVNVLYSSEYNIRVTKSRRVRWAAHVERMEEKSIESFGEEHKVKSLLGRNKRA